MQESRAPFCIHNHTSVVLDPLALLLYLDVKYATGSTITGIW